MWQTKRNLLPKSEVETRLVKLREVFSEKLPQKNNLLMTTLSNQSDYLKVKAADHFVFALNSFVPSSRCDSLAESSHTSTSDANNLCAASSIWADISFEIFSII